MSVPMGQMSCGNSALTWDSDNLGKDSRVRELSLLMQTVCKCSLKNTVWKWLKHWKAKRQTIPNKAACVQLCCWYHPQKVYTEVLFASQALLHINIIYGKSCKQKGNALNAFQCWGEVLQSSDTSCHPGKASLPQVIILPPSRIENNNKTATHRLPLSKLVVQSWNEKKNTKMCLS